MEEKENSKKFIIGTHNGIFHNDEIIAISILKVLLSEIKDIEIIRSRNIEFLKRNCQILVDIGGGKFDHHQKNGNGKRENGISYASAGLVWKKFGYLLIEKIIGNELEENEKRKIFQKVDDDIMQKIDMEDNGEKVDSHPFEFISSFLPNWIEQTPNYDEKFEEALDCASKVLNNYIKKIVAEELSKKELKNRINNKNTRIDNMLIIPSQTMPWKEMIVTYNYENENAPIDFVIFPYPAGGYALQCVPPTLEEEFEQRIKLPNDWAGETKNLSHISGVKTAILCHNGRFFARAKDMNDILLLGKIATSNFEKEVEKTRIRK